MSGSGPAPSLAPADAPVYMGLPGERVLRRRLYVSAALTAPILALAMGPMAGYHPGPASAWVQLALATPVFFWCGAFFNRRWWNSIRDRDPNMFTLTVTGTGAAYLYSVAAVILGGRLPAPLGSGHGPPLYFEATAFITSVVLLGQILEQRAHAKTEEAIRALMDLAPRIAHRVADGGGETDVALAEVAVGDALRVRPGEHVPVDGTVAEGASEVDASMVTGEPGPERAVAGAAVRAGTLNLNGTFVMRAERVGADTLLAGIVRLIEQARESEPPIARLADRVSAWFFPCVAAAAAVTFGAWMAWGPRPAFVLALLNAVAVLVIACPCALGLATPVSIAAAIGRGARAGILVRDAAALERLCSVRTVFIDKTGTLTTGRPGVRAVRPAAGWSEDELLRLAASAEAPSEHPVGRAIVAEAAARGLSPERGDEFSCEPGVGVTARVGARRIAVVRAEAAPPGCAGSSTVACVRVDAAPAGWIELEDTPRPGAAQAVRGLQDLGMRVVLVTGDREEPARALAEALGLDGFHAREAPADKQRRVAQARARGRVAFVGDGINDSAALAAADVGIAMGSGSNIAMDSAGLVLPQSDLAALGRAFLLSRATLANIRQNLFWAFAYNTLGIPVAAGVLYPSHGILLNPMLASIAMSLSSITVVSNALRLRNLEL